MNLDNLDDSAFIKQFNIALNNEADLDREKELDNSEVNEVVEEPNEIINDNQKKENQDNTETNLNTEEENKEETDEPKEANTPNELNLILAPIKANGKEIKINSIEELRSLASKGIDYTQKTQKLSKESRIAQSLANHGLTDEAKLNLLIDVAKGDKEAIKKHLKDLEINPFDLDIDNTDYKPINNLISEQEIVINNVIENIANLENGVKFLKEVVPDVFSEKEINNIVINQPSALKTLHDDYNKGIFKPIMDEINRLRAVKPEEFEGIEIEQFYGYVKHELFGSKQNTVTKDEVVTSNPKKVIDVKVKELKENVQQDNKINRLNATKVNNSTIGDNADDLFELSDEEFIKAMNKIQKSLI